MTFSEAMHEYYSGQRFVGLAGALVAIFYLIVARVTYIRAPQSARSFAITIFLIASCFMLPANVVYFFYVGPQSARIGSILARSHAEFDTIETAHLKKMMDGFHFSYRFDGAVALLGLLAAAVGFAAKNDKVIGAGLAVTLCATTLLVGEVWSKHRALHYREALSAARGAT